MSLELSDKLQFVVAIAQVKLERQTKVRRTQSANKSAHSKLR
jgi:hypothetical protein